MSSKMICPSFTRPVFRHLGLILGALLLGACASSPPLIRHYTLPGLATPAASSTQTVVLRVAPIELASHLDTRGLIYQDSPITLNEAQHHLWGQNLREQLDVRLRQHLRSSLPALQPRAAEMMQSADRRDYQLRVYLDQFQGRYDGLAVISGSWTLRDGRGELVHSQPFFETSPLGDNGHAEMVRSLAQAWQTLAQDIAGQLRLRDPRLQTADAVTDR